MEIEDGFLLAHVARPLPHERASAFRWQYEATRGGSAPPRTVYAATGNATPTGGFPAPIITCGVLGTDGMRPFDFCLLDSDQNDVAAPAKSQEKH